MSVQIFWDPKGFELDSLGSKKFLRATDGDTPYVSISVRTTPHGRIGMAAPFLIYPSLPRYEDLLLFWEAAKRAYEEEDVNDAVGRLNLLPG